MVKCSFTTKYQNFESHREMDFYCEKDEDILNSGLCIFHDKNYLQDKASRGPNEQNVRDKLMAKISENVMDTTKPLLCIGYYLPSIKINETFVKPAYFSKCKFQTSTALPSSMPNSLVKLPSIMLNSVDMQFLLLLHS
ncbi:MAG: hypothetical protein WCC17_24995 [Candidatus Nitrosopolaris sp.]